MEESWKAFPYFAFEDREVDGNEKARCSIMIRNEIKYERLKKYEDNKNSSVAIRIKDGKNKLANIMGIYRQWKLKGDFNANDQEGIRKEVETLKVQCSNIDNMCRENKHCILAGDINIDKCKKMTPTNDLRLKH